jgi:hypothetical protein
MQTNVDHLIKNWEAIERGIDKANTNTPYDVLKIGERLARSIAPVKKGQLKEGIKAFKQRNSAVLQSRAISKDRYKVAYNLWVNENYPSLRIFGGQPRSYRSTNKTGVPGYFDLTMEFLVETFPEMYSMRVGRVLRIK